jgi:hypothetical protein
MQRLHAPRGIGEGERLEGIKRKLLKLGGEEKPFCSLTSLSPEKPFFVP